MRWYLATIHKLLAPADSLDPGDLGSWALRRWVARGMITAPVVPLVLGGMWAWDRLEDSARARALAASPCVRLAPPELGTPSGSADELRCDAYYDDDVQVTWLDRSVGITGETELETWETDPVEMSFRQDGGGHRYLVLIPIEHGRLEVHAPHGIHSLASAIVARAMTPR